MCPKFTVYMQIYVDLCWHLTARYSTRRPPYAWTTTGRPPSYRTTSSYWNQGLYSTDYGMNVESTMR